MKFRKLGQCTALLAAVAILLPAAAFGNFTSTTTGMHESANPTGTVVLGTPLVVNAELSDWGVNPGTFTTSDTWASTRGMYTIHDTGYHAQVGPGIGGQNFDIEAMYTGWHWDGVSTTGTLYVAIVTGFDIRGQQGSGPNNPSHVDYIDENSTGKYFVGDVFVALGTQQHIPHLSGALSTAEWDTWRSNNANWLPGSWDLAFGLTEWSTSGLTSAADPTLSGTLPVYGITGAIDLTPTGVAGYSNLPYDANNGGASSATQTAATNPQTGSVQFAYHNNRWAGDHNVYEFAYTGLTPLDVAGGYGIFWTMNCGNDFMHLVVPGGLIPTTPVVPVPAAAGLGLLGMAMVGVMRRKRR